VCDGRVGVGTDVCVEICLRNAADTKMSFYEDGRMFNLAINLKSGREDVKNQHEGKKSK
jgi:hypothetical protein